MRSPCLSRLTKGGCKRLDLFEADPVIRSAANRPDAAADHPIDDRHRLGKQGICVQDALAQSPVEVIRRPPNCVVGFRRPPRETKKALRFQTVRAQLRENAPQPNPRIALVFVRRVVCESLVAGLAEGDKIGLRNSKQGSKMPETLTLDDSVHSAESGHARSSKKAKKHRLRLIVGVMRGSDRVGPDFVGVADKETVTRLPSALLNASCRLRPAPRKNGVGDAETGA